MLDWPHNHPNKKPAETGENQKNLEKTKKNKKNKNTKKNKKKTILRGSWWRTPFSEESKIIDFFGFFVFFGFFGFLDVFLVFSRFVYFDARIVFTLVFLFMMERTYWQTRWTKSRTPILHHKFGRKVDQKSNTSAYQKPSALQLLYFHYLGMIL